MADPFSPQGIVASQYKVMVLDDIPVNTRLLEKILEKEGFQLFIFNNSIQALDAIQRIHPDILLLDMMMPGIDGPTFLKNIRSSDAFDSTRVIMVTAVSEAEEMAKMADIGANGYVTKPINARTLVNTIYEQIQQLHK